MVGSAQEMNLRAMRSNDQWIVFKVKKIGYLDRSWRVNLKKRFIHFDKCDGNWFKVSWLIRSVFENSEVVISNWLRNTPFSWMKTRDHGKDRISVQVVIKCLPEKVKIALNCSTRSRVASLQDGLKNLEKL